MTTVRRSTLLAIAALLAAAAPSFGQAPSSLNTIAARGSALTDDDRSAISAYATKWGATLATAEDLDDVRRAQNRLLDPVGLPGLNEVFRDTYGRAVIPALQAAIDSDAPMRPVNALIIIGQLRTDAALDELLDHCSIRDETRVYVRQAAALSTRSLLHEGLASANPRRITSAARRLRDASRDEPERLVLERLLTALAAADDERMDTEARNQVRGYLIEALGAIVGRATSEPDTIESLNLIAAAQPAFAELRNVYIHLDLDAQRAIGRSLAPTFGRVLEIPAARWDDLRSTAVQRVHSADRCEKLIAVTESFLRFGDRVARGNTQPAENGLRDAWRSNDASGYRAVLGEWQALLGQPPY